MDYSHGPELCGKGALEARENSAWITAAKRQRRAGRKLETREHSEWITAPRAGDRLRAGLETRTYLINVFGATKALEKRPFGQGQTIYEMASRENSARITASFRSPVPRPRLEPRENSAWITASYRRSRKKIFCVDYSLPGSRPAGSGAGD